MPGRCMIRARWPGCWTPTLFELKPCRIDVETVSDLTRGHTAVEFRVDAATAPHRWAVKADGQGVFDLITESLECLP